MVVNRRVKAKVRIKNLLPYRFAEVLYTYFEQHGWHHLSETCVFHQLLEYYPYSKELRREALKDLEQCHLVIKYNLLK